MSHQQLPPIQTGPAAWYGADMVTRENEWLLPLTQAEIAEIEAAAEPLVSQEFNIGQMTKRDFNLPTVGPKLTALRQDLIQGRGFVLLRGLPVATYNEREAATIFYGLGTHVGSARSQNAKGHVLGHVRNLGVDSNNPNVRIYQTKERQTFHTDSTDVVGLLCLQPAKAGGHSLLVSATTIFNEMHKRRPDLLELLLQPIATDRRGEVPEGMLPYLLIPVFSWHEGYVTPFYQRQYIDSAQRFPDAPRLTEKHVEALDLFDELANDSTLNFSMTLAQGDVQLVYNHNLLHDRTGFEDWPDLARRRHLLRLWLSVPEDRPLPDIFATRFGSIEIGNRGGIIVPGSQLCVPWLSELPV
ncbi:MAG: TauD/TfdA family dioxygenase [Chloroflexota bacterium]